MLPVPQLLTGMPSSIRRQQPALPKAFRLLDRANKIRGRLGKPSASGDPLPRKLHRMRWSTYHRLECRVLRLETPGGWQCRRTQIAAGFDKERSLGGATWSSRRYDQSLARPLGMLS